MKVLVCGGNARAVYVVNSFASPSNRLVVLTSDEKEAETLSKIKHTEVYLSDPTKIYSFEITDIYDFDLIISLLDVDADNFIACTIAKKIFNIKKSICTVNNPNIVQVFKDLGIDSPISSSYLLAEKIHNESDINALIKTMSLENSRIVITEINVNKDFYCANKELKNLNLPVTGNITCIYREPSVLIPRGDTKILAGDILVVASAPNNQNDLINFIRKGK